MTDDNYEMATDHLKDTADQEVELQATDWPLQARVAIASLCDAEARIADFEKEIYAWHLWFFETKRLWMHGDPKDFEKLFFKSPYGKA